MSNKCWMEQQVEIADLERRAEQAEAALADMTVRRDAWREWLQARWELEGCAADHVEEVLVRANESDDRLSALGEI